MADNDNNGDEKSKIIKSLEDVNTLPSRVAKSVYDIHEQLSVPTKHQASLEARHVAAKKRLQEVNQLAAVTGDPTALEVFRKRQGALKERIIRTKQQIQFEESSREEVVRRDAYSRASSMLSEERLEINTRKIAKTPGARFLAEDIAGSSSQAELEKVAQINTAKQSEIAREMIGLSRNVGDIGSKNRMSELARELSQLQVKGGRIGAAISLQREMGLDDVSLKRQASTLSEKISKEQMREGVAAEIKSGKVGSYQEELETYRKLRDAVKKTAEEMSELSEISVDLRKKQEQQIDAFERQEEKVKQMDRQGGGGGGISQRLQNFGMTMQAVAGVARYAGVTSEIEQNNARAGLAAIMNQRFLNQKSALSGDMQALLMEPALDDMIKRSEDIRQRSRTTAGADIVAEGAIVAGQAMGNAATLKFGDVVAAGSQGAAAVVNKTVAVSKGITQSQDAISMQASQLALLREMTAIPGQSLQEFFNERMKAYRSSIGTGNISSSLMSEMTDRQLQSDIGFIDLDRQKGLFSKGVSQVGRSFIQSAQERQAVIRAAARAESTGAMSAEQYIGGLGQITAGGGSRKDFEELMANAVARGVGDAENINKMVEYSANLAESIDQGRGVGGVTTSMRSLAFGLQSYEGTGMDERQRLRGAAFGIQNMQNITGNVGLNLETMSQMAFLSKNLPGVSGVPLQNVLKLGTQGASDVLRMMREDPNSKKTARTIQDLGLKSVFYNQDGSLKKDALSTAQTILQSEIQSTAAGAGIAMTSDQYEEFNKFIKSGKKGGFSKLSTKLQDTLTGLGLTESAWESVFGQKTGDKTLSGKALEPTGDVANAQKILKTSTDATIKNMDAFGASLKKISDMMDIVAKDFDPKESTRRATGAATEMHLDVKDFDASVKGFAEAVDAFRATQGMPSAGQVPQPTPGGISGNPYLDSALSTMMKFLPNGKK